MGNTFILRLLWENVVVTTEPENVKVRCYIPFHDIPYTLPFLGYLGDGFS